MHASTLQIIDETEIVFWIPNDTVQKLLKDSRLRHVSFSDKKARHTFPGRAQYATHSLKGTVSQRALHETHPAEECRLSHLHCGSVSGQPYDYHQKESVRVRLWTRSQPECEPPAREEIATRTLLSTVNEFFIHPENIERCA